MALLEIVEPGMARFVQSRHLPKGLESISMDPDVIGVELGQQLLALCEQRFDSVHARPLVSGGGLFGAVAMFFASDCSVEKLALAEGLIDLAAITLESVERMHQLTQSHAELRASHELLIRSEKMRALGEMAAGVSHDLTNILNPLSLHLQMAGRWVDQGKLDEAKQGLLHMKQVLVRGVQTIERLRDYGRQAREPRPDEEVELSHLLREAGEIARPRIAERRVSIQYRVEESGPAPVRGRSGEIVSALVNLIVNAIDAMTAGGTITFRSGSDAGGSWAEIADDGPGMPPEVERRVFEPFFSTKGDAGTGLGLAMVYACMKRHGGNIKLDTGPGIGTTFRLSFSASGHSIPPPSTR